MADEQTMIASSYQRDGYYFPVDAMNPEQAHVMTERPFGETSRPFPRRTAGSAGRFTASSSTMGSASLLCVRSVAPARGFTAFNREIFVKQFLAET